MFLTQIPPVIPTLLPIYFRRCNLFTSPFRPPAPHLRCSKSSGERQRELAAQVRVSTVPLSGIWRVFRVKREALPVAA